MQYATKIKSITQHIEHNAVFDNKYMKLFDVRISDYIRTFDQFLSDFSHILETRSYFVLLPTINYICCI